MSNVPRQYFTCGHCGEGWDVTDVKIGDIFECNNCHSKFPITDKKYRGWRSMFNSENQPKTDEQWEQALKEREDCIEMLAETLRCFELVHEHEPGAEHIRKLGEEYGWCYVCSTKVVWGPGEAEQALSKLADLKKRWVEK